MRKFWIPAAMFILLIPSAQAGGPALVAGASFFDPSVVGTPLTCRKVQSPITQIRET